MIIICIIIYVLFIFYFIKNNIKNDKFGYNIKMILKNNNINLLNYKLRRLYDKLENVKYNNYKIYLKNKLNYEIFYWIYFDKK